METSCQKILLFCLSTIFVLSITIFYSDFVYANDDQHKNKTYNEKIIKSRADRGYTNEGTIIYNYQEIDSYDDALEGEAIGNFTVEKGSRVREINSIVKVKDNVKSEKEVLDIGKINIEEGGSVRKINNTVTIDGDIEGSGESMEIGTVRAGKHARINNVVDDVIVKGKIDAK